MEKGEQGISDFDPGLWGRFFAAMDRQGPGCDEQTLLALGFVGQLGRGSRVADMGAGTGAQTLVLAEYTPAHITAVDFLPQMIGSLRERVAKAGYEERVEGVIGAMDEVTFEDGSLDLVWAEGSVANVGFQSGLARWNRFLRPGGCAAVSDLSWLTHSRPEEIERYMAETYPQIASVQDKIAAMQKAGYRIRAAFALPEDCWTENYYEPMARRLETFAAELPDDPQAERLIGRLKREMEMYERYGGYYGCVLYIGEKV